MDREHFYNRFSTTTREAGDREGFLQKGTFKRHRPYWEILLMFVVAFNLVFGVVRPFVAEPMRVPSPSMAPTLKPHDRVLTNKLAYDLVNPDRGDIAVFENVEKDAKHDELVKRVVGLPGDVVQVDRGVLKVNGEPQHEPYLAEKEAPEALEQAPGVNSFGPMFVPEDHVFVMGDNRAKSQDSRFFGPVPTEDLVGEVALRIWPPDRLGTP